MTLNQIKNQFQEQLGSLYPKEEIDNFFFILTEEYLNLKRIDIALDPDKKIDQTIQKHFNSALDRLKNEEPVQYIIGTTIFYDLHFKVNKNVLIPRPETEELVNWILQEVRSLPAGKGRSKINILDIGTGSGCIAVSLAKNLPEADVWAMDISEKALETARQNAALNNVKIQFLKEDILQLTSTDQKFDIIVSNPPYVRIQEKHQMKKNVLKYEPDIALFVKDDDPLLFYRKITHFAKNNLYENAKLFFEINQYLAKETSDLLKNNGFTSVEIKKDIFGNDRMIMAKFNHRNK